MKKGVKILLVIVAVLAVVTVFEKPFPYTGKTVPLKAPASDTPPTLVISTSSPSNDLWDVAYEINDILRVQFGGNAAVDIDEAAGTVMYSVWLDSLSAYALDKAMIDYTAYTSWHNILESLPKMCEQMEHAYNEKNWGDVSVKVNIVDPFDFEVLLAAADASGVTYDIVDQTPAGETVSANVYGDGSAVIDTINSREIVYIVNRESKVFHLSKCSAVDRMNEGKKTFVRSTHNELIAMGYSPCKICNP